MFDTLAPVRSVRSEADYRAALADFERYFDNEPAPGSADADRFELLGIVLAKYEDEHFPIEAPDPVTFIREVMAFRGYEQRDLASVLGSRSRASEILQGRRELSLDHIRRLRSAWRIPADALIGPDAA